MYLISMFIDVQKMFIQYFIRNNFDYFSLKYNYLSLLVKLEKKIT